MTAGRPPSDIRGVEYGTLERHDDERGSFRELWRESGHPGRRFVQVNLSVSASGVLRGLHLHRRQDDLWIVVGGRARVALVDVRPLVSGTGPSIVETREMGVDDHVVIPAGVAHGFLALEPLRLAYLVTNEFDGSDEFGFAWDDPAVAVPWLSAAGTHGRSPILSPRDRTNPPLAELVTRLRDLDG